MTAVDLCLAIKLKSQISPEMTLNIINDLDPELLNQRTLKEETYLHLIAHAYKTDEDAPCLLPIVFQLSNAGIDRNAVDQDGNTALHIAVKGRYSRRLIRALLMIGVDPTIINAENQTAAQLVVNDVDNSRLISHFYPGLWEAISHSSLGSVTKLLHSWCKVDFSHNYISLTEHAEDCDNADIIEAIHKHSRTIQFVHCALAGDRQRLRPFFQDLDLDKDAVSDTYIDVATGNFVTMPLIGEVALLSLTAIVRKMIRKKCDVTIDVDGKPLPLYVLQNMTANDERFSEMFYIFIDKIDLCQYQEHATAFLDAAYEKMLPWKVVGTMAANGLDLFATDDEGRFLRDRILLKNAEKTRHALLTELKFTDDIIVDLAERGCVNYLKMLGESFYQHLVVENQHGVSTETALEHSVGTEKASSLLLYVDKLQKTFLKLIDIIKDGDLSQFIEHVTNDVMNVRDPYGRSLVHHIAQYERGDMLGYYTEMFQPLVNVLDKTGRTPLFWACALEYGKSIEEQLTGLGCIMDQKDKNGVSPADVMLYNRTKKEILLAGERSREIRKYDVSNIKKLITISTQSHPLPCDSVND